MTPGCVKLNFQQMLQLCRMLLHLIRERDRQVAMKAAKSGILAFNKDATKRWDAGVSLEELLVRVNRVAAKLLPAEEGGDSRVSPTLLPRTFRHYVTLGCIDTGRREGRRVVYGLRHFLQALLVRRLLFDHVPVSRMADLIAGGSDAELERMLLGGVEIVARPGGEEAQVNHNQQLPKAFAGRSVSGWLRVELGEGIEIHLSDKRPKMTPGQRRQMLKRIEELVTHL